MLGVVDDTHIADFQRLLATSSSITSCDIAHSAHMCISFVDMVNDCCRPLLPQLSCQLLAVGLTHDNVLVTEVTTPVSAGASHCCVYCKFISCRFIFMCTAMTANCVGSDSTDKESRRHQTRHVGYAHIMVIAIVTFQQK